MIHYILVHAYQVSLVRPVLISSYTSGSCTLREVPCDAHDTSSQDTPCTTLAATLLD